MAGGTIHDPDVVRQVLESVLGFPDSSRRGGEDDYPCPFCIRRGYERQSHLHVNYRKGVALCHQCGGWSDLSHLVRALTGSLPRSMTQARLGVELVEYVRSVFRRAARAKDGPAPEPVVLPAEYVPLPERPGDPVGRSVRRYLVGRGLDQRTIDEAGIGYATSGRFRGYAIFPVHVAGELVTFTSRRVIGMGPKALHAPSSRSHLAVFNYDAAAAMGARRVFIGEGPFDGWAFHRRVRPDDAGVALLGKVLHDDQARLLGQLPCDELCVCLDDTEHARTMSSAARLSRLTSKKVSYLLLPEGSGDPHDNRENLPALVAGRHRRGGAGDDVRMLLA